MKERFKSAIKGNSFIVWLRIIYEKIGESFSLTLYNGSTNQTKVIYKKQAELQIRIHALEKGMSIGRVRVGFGKEKAFSLIEDLADLLKKVARNSLLLNLSPSYRSISNLMRIWVLLWLI